MKKNYINLNICLWAIAFMFSVQGAFAQLAVTTLTFNYTGSVQGFTVPPLCVNSITIEARGAQGGSFGSATGGLGARIIGDVTVTPGMVLQVYVGGKGTPSQNAGAGGGGSGVINGNTPLVIAGGGGGGSSVNSIENGQGGQITTAGGNSSGAGGTAGSGGQKGYMSGDCGWAGGGGGFLTDGYGGNGSWDGGALPGTLTGPAAGIARANGGTGGVGGGCSFSASGAGGWGCGGGGRGEYAGGGGGGYSGGGGGHYTDVANEKRGGGGGSFNAGTVVNATAGFQADDGMVIISFSSGNAVTVSASPSVICSGYSTTLTAVGPDNYNWNTGQPGSQVSAFPLVSTVFTVTGTDPNTGCSISATTAVEVLQSPIVSIMTLKSSVCVGESITMSAIGASSYTWSQGPVGNNIVTVYPTQGNSTYTVLGGDAIGCVTSSVIQITVNPSPVISVTGPAIICKNAIANLTASGAVSYVWKSTSALVSTNPVGVSPLSTTNYTVEGTDAKGCKGSVMYMLTIDPCTGIQNLSSSATKASLYPNPSNGLLTVELLNGLSKTIEVIDLTGKVILTSSTSKDVSELNISNLANGVYYVKIKSENVSEVIKIVKQ